MSKVIIMKCITKLDLQPSRVLDQVQALDPQTVVIIGYDKDGEMFFRSSAADGGLVLWLMEACKLQLLEVGGVLTEGTTV